METAGRNILLERTLRAIQGFPGYFFQEKLLSTLPETCQAKSYSSATYDSTEQMRTVKTNKGHFVKNTFS